jgi:TonB family protein
VETTHFTTQVGQGVETEEPAPLLILEARAAAVEALREAGKAVVGLDGVLDPVRVVDISPAYPYPAPSGYPTAFLLLQGLLRRGGGQLRNVEVLSTTHPELGFEKAALKAVAQWRFAPPKRGGQPLDAYMVFTLRLESSKKVTDAYRHPEVPICLSADGCPSWMGKGTDPGILIYERPEDRPAGLTEPVRLHHSMPTYPAMARR